MISRVILVLVIFFCFSFFLFDGVIRVGVVFRKPDFGRIATINGLEFSAAQQNSSSISLYKTAQRKLKLQSGIVSAISRLNYEFSNSEDSIHANDVNKKLPRVTKLNSMTILGDVPVGEAIPANTTRKVIILTSWRSGSSFLGDLLNHYPGTFYYFEPLHYYSYIKDKSKVQNETDFIKSLLSCEFDENNEGFLEHVRKPSNSFLFKRHNFRLWNSCKKFKPREALCYSQDYLNQLCPLYPIKLVKTVRMRVRQVDTLLRNSSNVKVIVLVRDPRAVFSSRWTGRVSAWCKQSHCSVPAVSCQDLADDVTAAHELHEKHPGQVRLVRFEDLSLSPTDTARSLLRFLDLPWHSAISNYVGSHTNKDVRRQDPYGTARNSTAAVYAWQQVLGFNNVSGVQEACKVPMGELGYRLITEEGQMLRQQPVLEKDAHHVWPY